MNYFRFLALIVGIIVGFVSTHYFLVGSWLNLFFWAIVGILLGLFILEKKEILWSGALYGFFLSMSFLLSGFQGTTDKLLGFILFSLGLSVIGMGAGIVFVYIGSWFRKRFK